MGIYHESPFRGSAGQIGANPDLLEVDWVGAPSVIIELPDKPSQKVDAADDHEDALRDRGHSIDNRSKAVPVCLNADDGKKASDSLSTSLLNGS